MSRTRIDSSAARDEVERAVGAELAAPAPPDARSLRPEHVVQLQRTVGNHAVAPLLVSREPTTEPATQAEMTVPPELAAAVNAIWACNDDLNRVGNWAIDMAEFLAGHGQAPSEYLPTQAMVDGLTTPDMVAGLRESGLRWRSTGSKLARAAGAVARPGLQGPARVAQFVRDVEEAAPWDLRPEFYDLAQLLREQELERRHGPVGINFRVSRSPAGQMGAIATQAMALAATLASLTGEWSTAAGSLTKPQAAGIGAEPEAVGIDVGEAMRDAHLDVAGKAGAAGLTSDTEAVDVDLDAAMLDAPLDGAAKTGVKGAPLEPGAVRTSDAPAAPATR